MAVIKIHLAERRKTIQTSDFRSVRTFDLEDAAQSDFFIQSCNEDTLKPKAEAVFTLPPLHYLLILPLAGEAFYENETKDESAFLSIGSYLVMTTEKPHIYSLSNQFQTELISFLQIQWLAPNKREALIWSGFDLKNDINTFIPLEHNIFIGKYAGRHEDIFNLPEPNTDVFVFVIEGAFEIDSRLVEAKSALSFYNRSSDIEIEALSEGAIILVILCYARGTLEASNMNSRM